MHQEYNEDLLIAIMEGFITFFATFNYLKTDKIGFLLTAILSFLIFLLELYLGIKREREK